MVALVLMLLIGFAALGTEVTAALLRHRQIQAAASSAALAAATALATGYPASPTVQALGVAAASGFVNNSAGVVVTVHSPPVSGSYAGKSNAVEVAISQPMALPLSSLFRAGPWNISARAVATIGSTGIYCVAALAPSGAGALTVSENASITSTTCGVAVNSNDPAALVMENNSAIAGPVNVVGGWFLGSHAVMNGSPVQENGPSMADPYADVTLGNVPACTGQSGSARNNAKVSLQPGHFCSGWSFGNNVELHLAPGTYYVDVQMDVANNAQIDGTGGVTLIVNGNYATNIGNNATLHLVAPTTGPFAGLALMGLGTSTSITQEFSNNVTLEITGSIYFPHQQVLLDNNGMVNAGGCTQLIAARIRISNNAQLNNDCGGTGVRPLGVTPSQLVE